MMKIGRQAVVAAVAAASGAMIAAGVIETTNGARETITLGVGDTVSPFFSTKTDSVLEVRGNLIIPKRCGVGQVFLRLGKGTVFNQVSADTITVRVTRCLDSAIVVTFSPIANLNDPRYTSWTFHDSTSFAKGDSVKAYAYKKVMMRDFDHPDQTQAWLVGPPSVVVVRADQP